MTQERAKSLYGLEQASRVWNETIDAHLKPIGFKATDADPCVYTSGEGNRECIVYLYMDNILIPSREKDIIASVKAGIAENFRIKNDGRAPLHSSRANHDLTSLSRLPNLSRFVEKSGQKHRDVGIKVGRYLLNNKDVGITYHGLLGTEVTAYSDADWAGSRDDQRSVSGMM
ncbi:Hypothetical protein PHPALM_12037 [Phytophthora palmivora]|uniref:Reverse transcriptase Ty1/copia-type domain-containing protein n=1 Tax=Phytophthora palmivora TaxID=4796 RepID=A0A2P4Y0S5_9STRA|nr:Hypothetical protein PHPALM_12037 [Phytophthora palmivora]